MEELHAKVIELTPIPIIIIDVNGDILSWNKKAYYFFGWTPEEVYKKKLSETILPDEIKGQVASDMTKSDTEKLKKLLGTAINIEVVRKDGSKVTVELHYEDTTVSEQTFTIYILELDTALNFVEMAAPKDHETLSTLTDVLQRSPVGVFAKSVEGKYIYINQTAQQKFEMMFGKLQFLYKTDFDIFPIEVAKRLRDTDIRLMDSTALPISTVEEDINVGTHTYTYITTRSRIVNKSGIVTGIFGFAYDISEYKNALLEVSNLEKQQILLREQIALASSKQKSEFLANMSHEIRTPLNAIMSFITLLLDTNLTAEQKDYLVGMRQSSTSLMSIINDILDISKIEAGRVQLEYINIDIKHFLDDLRKIYEHSAKIKNLEFVLHDRIPEENKWVKIDSGRLTQVLNNLVGNAIKFTFTGSVHVVCNYDSSESTLKFTIQDTGIGIPEEKQALLFKPFTQAETSTRRRFGGTGLGLSISKNLIELMGGNITFESEYEKGSVFYFELPFIQGTEVADSSDSEASVESHIKTDKFILVVDDNRMNLKVAMKFLEKENYKSIGCENGVEALHSLQTDPQMFNCVLMDCFMPIMDGYETTKKIREMPSPLCDIPIIAMTANALEGEREHCLEVGMNDYISKPIDRGILLSKVAYWIGRYVG